MAASLPVVASPTSVQAEMVDNGVTGMLAANEHAWIESIRQLASDEALRLQMGQAGRRLCEQRYAVEVGCKTLLDGLGRAMQAGMQR